jgi:hypothetical protein
VKLEQNKPSINVWNYKPWWCQPWSILLTGILIISSTWLLTKTLWITLGLSVPIFLWWSYFLIFYPQLFKKALKVKFSNIKSEAKVEKNIQNKQNKRE